MAYSYRTDNSLRLEQTVPNNSNESAANRGVSQNKAPGGKRKPKKIVKNLDYNVVKMNEKVSRKARKSDGFGRTSDRGVDRGFFRTEIDPDLDHAVDVLFNFSGKYSGVVAPSDPNSKGAVPNTQTISNLTLPNPAGVSATFESVVLHQLHPRFPVWNSTDVTPLIDQAVLEVYGDGAAWGLIYRADQRLASLSNYYEVNGRNFHGWTLANGNVATNLRCTGFGATFTVSTAPFSTGVWTDTASVGGTANVPLASVENYYMYITVTVPGIIPHASSPRVDLTFSVTAGSVTFRPNQKWNLLATTPTLYNDLNAKDMGVRVNSGGLVLTNCENQFQTSGTVLCARVESSQAPLTDWTSFLFQQTRHYMGKWKYGCFSPLFGTTVDGGYMDLHAYPVNQLPYNNALVNLIMINSTLYVAASSLQVQVKYSQWIDFITNDLTYSVILPKYKLLWVKVIALANLSTVPTDNPDHLDVMRKIKEAVKYIATSPQPQAKQIRSFIKDFSSGVLKAAPLLAEMAATIL